MGHSDCKISFQNPIQHFLQQIHFQRKRQLLFSSSSSVFQSPFPCVVYYYTTCIVCVGLNAESLALSPHPSPNILGNKSSFSVPEMTSLFCTIIHKNTFSFRYLQFTMYFGQFLLYFCLLLLENHLVPLFLILIDMQRNPI